MAFVKRELDPAAARAQRHHRAMDMGREHGIEVTLQSLGEQPVQRGAARRAQVRLVAVDALLPFAALDRDAVGRGLDGLNALLAGMPDSQREAVAFEQMPGRIEIGRDQMSVLGELSIAGAQAARGRQLLQIARGDFELDFGLNTHGYPLGALTSLACAAGRVLLPRAPSGGPPRRDGIVRARSRLRTSRLPRSRRPQNSRAPRAALRRPGSASPTALPATPPAAPWK